MKKSHVILASVAAAAMLLSVTSCGKGGSKEEAKKLVVWSFTDELQTMIDK